MCSGTGGGSQVVESSEKKGHRVFIGHSLVRQFQPCSLSASPIITLPIVAIQPRALQRHPFRASASALQMAGGQRFFSLEKMERAYKSGYLSACPRPCHTPCRYSRNTPQIRSSQQLLACRFEPRNLCPDVIPVCFAKFGSPKRFWQ